MDIELKNKIFSELIYGKNLEIELRLRKREYIYDSISTDNKDLLIEKLSDGWEKVKDFKTKIQIRKKKSNDISFEDKVWSVFGNLGFIFMNKNRYLNLPYDKSNFKLTQQINIFAKDNETVLIIECKTSEQNQVLNLEKEFEALTLKIDGLIKTIKGLFPDEKLKFKYILATEGYGLNENDLLKLKKINGVHFDEEVINYYQDLFLELGLAARYQLLGSLFHGLEIHEIDNLVPAVQGKMGGHTYYSFSIEPEKLLKIGYVLHRNKANENMMPTYQRIIKKNRLKQINNFIDENNGYFPNSIVISIDSFGKELLFDRSNNQVKGSIANVGVLHLPKKYRSAFIIDGQHRLYGYANSKYKNSNSIPVVAFIDLEREEQVKLFMEINENQKSVSKNLRLTLNSDLLWTSDNNLDKLKALKSRISISLGEKRSSPLFGKVSIGEDKKIITSEAIVSALSEGNFLGKVTKNKIEKLGTFYGGDLDECFEGLYKYISKSFLYIYEGTEDIWNKNGNIIVINKGIYSLIKILSDITDYLINKNYIKENFSINELYLETKNLLDPIITFYKNISDEQINELKTSYGKGGDIRYWRTLQQEIKKSIKDFSPDGLDDYLKREEMEFNEEAFKTIRGIEQYLNTNIREKLIEEFQEDFWFEEGVPPKIQDDAVKMAHQKKRENKKEEDPWNCLHIIDYRDIILKNWRNLFEKKYGIIFGEKNNGNKEDKTQWLVELNRLRNQNVHSYYITKEEFDFLKNIEKWLII